ncbi:MAG: NAD(P)/FAD-dependent oxidoreductase, partial [Lachnospiraceae bacterium]|nr:NAD(P)/FAD-dependent oxidoreductase [Lachnospiraceae bacterium]
LAKQPVRLTIDLKPALSEEQLEGRLLREIDAGRNKAMKHILEKLLPKSLVPVILKLSGIPPEKKGNILTKEERKALCALLKKLPLQVDGLRGYAEAVITKGGVSVKEIQPKTMESKLLLGLYLAGEVLDVDALTGGFNLQIAWSTGWAAGLACYEKNKGQKIS